MKCGARTNVQTIDLERGDYFSNPIGQRRWPFVRPRENGLVAPRNAVGNSPTQPAEKSAHLAVWAGKGKSCLAKKSLDSLKCPALNA